ncbi:MAG: sugar phosphate nucleotidyltransferase [Nitrospinota bacterium]
MQKCELAVVILAAGMGKRMKSDMPKVLHKLSGRPLVRWVVEAAKELKPARIIVITGHGGQKVMESLKNEVVAFAEQKEQLGTAHAVLQASKQLDGFDGGVMVLSGDVPMIKPRTLERLANSPLDKECVAAFLTTDLENPSGYGRVTRGKNGDVTAIIEERDATPDQKEIHEINGGVYFFDKKFLFETLPQVAANNAQKEYYLTDIVKIALNNGQKVLALKLDDPGEISGINSREELERLETMIGA